MNLLQLSASQGPVECALAVAKALHRIAFEAKQAGVAVDIIEHVTGPKLGTFRSVLLALDGAGADQLANRWCGTVQWVCQSPYRPNHGRKNWFIGVALFSEQAVEQMGEIRFEACRASGPGGQHVNKTDSAIRATHLASGISVKVQTQRSQHANKRLAVLLIEQKLADLAAQNEGVRRAERRMFHHGVERGNASLVFRGERFEPAT
ncbi:peptide chain release factor H [Chitinivorax sp. B]|uniref:peptide chain release factor H n=1 Tax=Chitinivorax sp. B TaxID=2502235 RepID=UPI0010F8D458|nr:peptide chain release factor H [Chitinivorax sp. B]